MIQQAVTEATVFCAGDDKEFVISGIVTNGYLFNPTKMQELSQHQSEKGLKGMKILSLGNACDEGTLRRFVGRDTNDCIQILFNAQDIVLSDPALLELQQLKPGLLEKISKEQNGDAWQEMRRKRLFVKYRDLTEKFVEQDNVLRLREIRDLGVALSMGQSTVGSETLLHLAAKQGAIECIQVLLEEDTIKSQRPHVAAQRRLLYFHLGSMPKKSKRELRKPI